MLRIKRPGSTTGRRMVGPNNILEIPVDDLSTDDVGSLGTETVEDDALEGVPQEVIRMIGAYETDCAGGCG